MAKRKYAICVGADPNRFDNVEFNSEYSAKLSLAALKVELNRQVQVVELVEVKHEKYFFGLLTRKTTEKTQISPNSKLSQAEREHLLDCYNTLHVALI